MVVALVELCRVISLGVGVCCGHVVGQVCVLIGVLITISSDDYDLACVTDRCGD